MIQMSESRLRRPGALCARQQDRPSTALPGDPRGSSHQAATPQVFRCQDRREPDWPEPRCRNAARPVVSPSSRPRLRRQVGPLCACRPTPLVPGGQRTSHQGPRMRRRISFYSSAFGNVRCTRDTAAAAQPSALS